MANKLRTLWCVLVAIKNSALTAIITAGLGLLGSGVFAVLGKTCRKLVG